MIASYTPDLPGLLQLAIAFLLPLVVGLVTKMSDNSAYKAILLLVLSAVSTVLSEWLTSLQNDRDWEWKNTLLNVGVTFVFAVAAHYGFWKPTGTSAKVQKIGVRDKGVHTG